MRILLQNNEVSMPPAVLIAIDGLRPDALAAAHCPTLASLRRRGACTLRARSVVPPVSLPCFVSIFRSQPPQQHGVTSNVWAQPAQPVLGLADVARGSSLRCGFFHNWEPLRNVSIPGALHVSFFRDNLHDGAPGDGLIAHEAMRYMRDDAPDFVFVYLGSLDIAGHDYGWMSDEYMRRLESLDGLVGLLLEALPAGATALVTADHGGHERQHGLDVPEDMTVPLFVVGPAIRPGHEISAPVSLLDVAPTLARVLGLTAPREWRGRCLDEAFVS